MSGNNIELTNLLGSPSFLASEISKLWVNWKNARSAYDKSVAETKAYVFATDTRKLLEGNDWNHSTHIPKITSLFDQLKANYMEAVAPDRNWMRVESEEAGALRRDKQIKIQSYLQTKHRMRHFRETLDEMMDDWILEGNVFGEVVYVKEYGTNPLTGDRALVYQGPELRKIAPADIAFNIMSTSFLEAPKIVRRLYTIGDLEKMLMDEQIATEGGWDLWAINDLIEKRSHCRAEASVDLNKSAQISVDGFGTAAEYLQGTVVEALEFYGDIYDAESRELHRNVAISVMDRSTVVRNVGVRSWSGHPHIFHCPWRKRNGNLWGMGPLENLVGMQYRINHLENSKADAFDEMLMGDLVFRGDVEVEYGDNNQKVYRALDPQGDVRRLAPDTTVLNADFQIEVLEAKMEMFAGSPRELSGFRTPGEKTKFEVEQLKSAGSKLFYHKVGQLERLFIGPVINAELEVSVLNMSSKDLARATDPTSGVKEVMTITREDLYFNGSVIPVGSTRKAYLAKRSQDLRDFSIATANDQDVLAHFPAKKLAKLWEEVMEMDEFTLFEEFGRVSEMAERGQRENIVREMTLTDAEAGAMEIENGG